MGGSVPTTWRRVVLGDAVDRKAETPDREYAVNRAEETVGDHRRLFERIKFVNFF